MARGPRKSLDEKIEAKQELIRALLTRVDAEKAELARMLEEKRLKELETVSEMMDEYGLEPDDVVTALQHFLESREEGEKQEEAS